MTAATKSDQAVSKLRETLGWVPDLSEEARSVFDEWVAEVTLGGASPRFGCAISSELDALAWRVSLEGEGKASPLEAHGSDHELARFDVAVEQTGATRVCHWVESRLGAFERGWRIDAELPFVRTLALLAEPNPKVIKLSEFGEANHIQRAIRLGRSYGLSGNPFTEVMAVLPGEGEEALELGLQAYSALRIPRLPAMLVEAFRACARGQVSLSVWLTDQALAKVGLVLSHPTAEDVARLVEMMGTELEPLRELERALGVAGPIELECAIARKGPMVQLEYGL